MELQEANKIEVLRRAIEQAKAREDWPKFFEKIEELGEVYMDYAFTCAGSLDFSSAYNYFTLANQSFKEFYENHKMVLSSLDREKEENKSVRDGIIERFNDLEKSIDLSQGYAFFSLGQVYKSKRNPGDAVENFKEAKEIFDLLYQKTNEGIYKFLSDCSHANKVISEAFESFIRGNVNNAKSGFQRAKIFMKKILDTLPNYIKGSESEKEWEYVKYHLSKDYKDCEICYYHSDAMDQFDKGNFSLSLEQYEKACKILSETIESTPDNIPKQIENSQLGQYHVFLCEKYIVEGELFREEEKWDQSLECYKKAKDELEKGAEFYLISDLRDAVAVQEALINKSSQISEVYIRQCKKERELKNKIKKLEDERNALPQSLIDAIKPAGVTVNTTQEMVLTVEQNVQFIQLIEDNVKQNIKELVEHLDDLDVDKSKKDEIKTKANDLLKTGEHGLQFLGQAKKFTKEVIEFTKNLGEIAKPILPFVKALSLLL